MIWVQIAHTFILSSYVFHFSWESVNKFSGLSLFPERNSSQFRSRIYNRSLSGKNIFNCIRSTAGIYKREVFSHKSLLHSIVLRRIVPLQIVLRKDCLKNQTDKTHSNLIYSIFFSFQFQPLQCQILVPVPLDVIFENVEGTRS